MQFSSHISGVYYPPICEFKELAQKKINHNQKIYDLNQAVPNYEPPTNIIEAIKDNIQKPGFANYTAGQGLIELRTAIKENLSILYVGNFCEDNICVVAGANNAFFSVIHTIVETGGEVILLTPYYFNHYMGLKMCGIKVVEVALNIEQNLSIPIEKIKNKFTSKTKAVVLVNPGNPTGRSYSQKEVDALYKLCAEYEIILISDEVYNYFHSDYPLPASLLNCNEWWKFGVAIHSYSKTFSITGFRVGFVVASEEFLYHFLKVHDTAVICAPKIAQLVALEGLRGAKQWLQAKIELMNARKDLFCRVFTNNKPASLELVSAGPFFVYLKIISSLNAFEFCSLLMEKENIVMLPGKYFGASQEKMIRVALGNIDEQNVKEVLEILQKY